MIGLILLALPAVSWARPQDSAKGIIRSGSAQGVAVEIVDVKTGRLLSANTRFHNGQTFRLRIQTSMPGHLYLVNVSPSGRRTQIFPQQRENNFYEAGSIELPAPDQPPFQFDNESGVEMIQVAISPTTIGAFEQARFQPELASAREAGLLASSTASGGFSNSNAAKGIIRPDGITFPDRIGPGEFFTFVVSLVHN